MGKAAKPRNKNLTIPNALSVLRILIVPFAAWAFLTGHTIVATVLVGVSGLTDLFDGFIARKFDQVTELGKILDPFADKLTQGVVALCLAIRYPPICAVLLLFILKELIMLACAVILLKKKKRPCAARWYGKVATTMFYIAVCVILVMDGFFGLSWAEIRIAAYILLIPTAGMMIYSAVRYFQVFLQILASDDKEYAFDLPDEMRAKVVREKPERGEKKKSAS